ncbi:hypothetical protein [Micromonospora schwarzwaldensis]|uniref:hypothetical protein n=1 Tax=Micromonospora sp. DSM 45708 TaxID=3111767 RepID=UPI0031D9B960
MATALYDDIADWYEEYARDTSGPYMDRVRSVLAELLGRGPGRCLDLCWRRSPRRPGCCRRAAGWCTSACTRASSARSPTGPSRSAS